MHELKISLSDLPAEGREFTFDGQEFWAERFDAFDLSATPGKPIVAVAHVTPQGQDVLIRGTLAGSLLLSCNRCAEKFELALDLSFDEYESKETEGQGEESRISEHKSERTLDMGAVLWEQLMLTLPVKPVCDSKCKGVCPGCGANLNEGTCDCIRNEGDPRLAVFRDLKLK